MAVNPRITVKQGEAKTIKFTIRDAVQDLVDVANPTLLTFSVEDRNEKGTLFFTKANADFDKTNAVAGVVTVPISSADTSQDVGVHTGELKIEFTAANIDKSIDIDFKIERSIT